MQMDIQSQGFSLTDGLRDYVMKRLAYALNHGDDHITQVTVRLSDINGPYDPSNKSGDDKRCLIELRLKAAPAIVIDDTESDLYVAIDRAAERAGRTLARRLARQREFAPGLPVAPEQADWAERIDAPAPPHGPARETRML
jgi:ribosomal subunit interface protein